MAKGGNYSRFHENPQSLCTVIAFDPGETTGYCVMGVDETKLLNCSEDGLVTGLYKNLDHIEYGEIDCRTSTSRISDYEKMIANHAGIGLLAEAIGVSKMIDLAAEYPDAAIVLEDFVVDMRKIDQARHTLSPVRIISSFFYGMYMGEVGPVYERTHIQNRSLHKTTCTDDRLELWGLYDTHSGPHARDATRIAYYFLRKCVEGHTKKAAENRWLAWPDRFSDPVDRTKKKRVAKQGTRIESIR